MYPIAHAWLIERLVPAPMPAHYLGCVWPDMLYDSPLSHTQSHRGGDQLVALAVTLAEGAARDEFLAFVAGVLSHGAEPHGFDWYSDEQWGDTPAGPPVRGYAFQRGRPLAPAAARACDVAPEQGEWKAHNLIEMSFERPLYSAEPALGERLAAACADERLVARIAAVLGPHFGVDPAALVVPMRRFPAVVELRPVSVEALAQVYTLQTRLRHPGASPDSAALAALLARAEELTEADGQAFLETCVARVGAMLRAALPAPA